MKGTEHMTSNIQVLAWDRHTYVAGLNRMTNRKRTNNTMANRRKTDNTMTNRRTDNTMANRRRTNNDI
jgi:hypothetical protein